MGVAVGHIQMTDDQVLGNVMLSAYQVFFYDCLDEVVTDAPRRYQLPRFSAQEELAERQVPAHQVHDGQAYPSVLKST